MPAAITLEMLPYVSELTLRHWVDCTAGEREVKIVRRHPHEDSWAIVVSAWVWTRKGKLEDEPMPSSRTPAFLKRARWTLGEAWPEAKRLVALGSDLLR